MNKAAAVLLLAMWLAPSSNAQSPIPAVHGRVEKVQVHGRGLEGNLEGDTPDRDVYVYLPPGYVKDTKRRFPVLYFLHGYTDSPAKWFGTVKHWINLPDVLDRAMVRDDVRQMIVVMPDAYTRYQGSMYSNSVTTGDWEDFVAAELVSFIDGRYRTIPDRMSRGLAGHSMGGYGTVRIGMKRPDAFSSIYALSACCMTPPSDDPRLAGSLAKSETVRTIQEFESADFGARAQFASGAAWSPNPKKPPFFLDLSTEGGKRNPNVAAKWAANAPLSMIDQYITNLRKLTAIGLDAGNRDEPIASASRALDAVLASYGIGHAFEIYDGDHLNHIADRIQAKTMPFFSKNLKFEAERRK